ncbi:PQQ-binding-like beta-propeller repeat protein [Haloferax sp. DFSO60]|uniref:outer membrane protein assembly factor BamB family protein n=1 Tax=Haloferax sp. DFSO60 TaxID=3388652 RepID=UPI00397E431E
MPSPTRRRFLATLGASALVTTVGCLSGIQDRPTYDGMWSRYGGDDARTGATPGRGVEGDLYPAWRTEVFDGFPTSSPVVSDGVVYYLHTRGGYDTEHESVVSAYDAKTGEEQWRTTVSVADREENRFHHDSVVVEKDRLYARTFEGLHALDTNGNLLWTEPIPTTDQPWPVIAPPIVSDELAITATYGDREPPVQVVALDSETGDPVWEAGFSTRRFPWTLSAFGDTVYVPFFGGDSGLVGLDIATGERLWERSMPIAGPVTVTNQTILTTVSENVAGSDSDQRYVVALDRRSREVRWKHAARKWSTAGVATTAGLVYYCDDNRLLARRLDTGELEWSFGPDPLVMFDWTPAIIGATIYVVVEHTDEERTPNYLYALDTSTGEVRGVGKLSVSASPSGLALVDGALYVALGNGELRCYESCATAIAGECLLG